MNSKESYLFSLLKKAVATTFLQKNSAPNNLSDWKGDDIIQFQEDLFHKVNAKVSEKWFYTYFKNEPTKLPRIDMLNLLSNYVGFDNWNSFKNQHQKVRVIKKGSLIKFASVIVLVVIVVSIFQLYRKNTFHFCFIDQYKGESITNIALDIKIINTHESPIYLKSDSLGCFTYTARSDKIMFVVQSPFHKTDTIMRYIGSYQNKEVQLTMDDYALMLNYYSNGNIKDWKKRKLQLEELIADDALIYQLHKSSLGIELYRKAEFIRKLTIPTQNLKRIKILEKQFEDEKIVKLKFMVE